MIINLTDKQLEECLGLAQARHDAKHASFRNRDTERFQNESKLSLAGNVGVDPQYMPHFIGVLGEMAWSIHTGEPIDEEIYAVRDNGEDFAGTEVKTLTYFGKGEPELKIPQTEYSTRTSVETYVLARVNPEKPKEIELLGQISRDVFDIIKKAKRYGRYKPNNYVVPKSAMERVE